MDPIIHEIKVITIGYVRCECLWSYRVENFKGKTDEDLSAEVLGFFDLHKREATTSER